MNDEVQARVQRVFGGLVVNKKAALVSGLEGMPRFVVEFLIASALEQKSDIALEKIRDQIKRYYADSSKKNAIISRVMTEGKGLVIDMLSVEPRPEKNDHVAHLARLDLHGVPVAAGLLDANPQLLHGGMWGSIELGYQPDDKKGTLVVDGFKPYQLPKVDIEPFKRGRSRFSFDEWVDLIVTTCGFNSAGLPTLRHKLLLLTRLVPLAQGNVNIVELGPKNTGKSYFLRNLSSRVYLSSGARVTPASLFYNQNTKRMGVVGVHRAVIFDEVNATNVPDPSLVAALLDYLESGNYAAGGKTFTSDCSVLFTGNIGLSPDGKGPRADYPHLFQVFPAALNTSALVDRIHGFIPGWELPRISDQMLSNDMGFLSDYFGEVVSALRHDSAYQDVVHQYMGKLSAEGAPGVEVTIRDRKAIEKIATGLTRVLFPDLRVDEEAMRCVIDVAVEMRQRVHAQMTRMDPGNYKKKTLQHEGRPAVLLEEKAFVLTEMDGRANTEPLTGRITILFAFEGASGGDRGFVECSQMPGTGYSVTGMHGTSMAHSIKTAYEALLSNGGQLGVPSFEVSSKKLAVHLVNIADPRDGPSAGLAFAIAMASAVSGRAIRPGFAVTGELSLHGHVLEVGGVAEKLQAAARYGRTRIIIPFANKADADQVGDLKLEVHAVRSLAEALSHALV
jgi:ATP-dependent Lon protease